MELLVNFNLIQSYLFNKKQYVKPDNDISVI